MSKEEWVEYGETWRNVAVTGSCGECGFLSTLNEPYISGNRNSKEITISLAKDRLQWNHDLTHLWCDGKLSLR